jgi:hypothetical protein
MIESFLYGTWIGGHVLYWFFLRLLTQLHGACYWEALELRLGRKPVQEH